MYSDLHDCMFTVSVLQVLSVNNFAVRDIDQSCGVRLVFGVILDRAGVKQMKDRGVGRLLFEGGDYFKYFAQKGVIIRGQRLMEGRLLFEDLWYAHLVK